MRKTRPQTRRYMRRRNLLNRRHSKPARSRKREIHSGRRLVIRPPDVWVLEDTQSRAQLADFFLRLRLIAAVSRPTVIDMRYVRRVLPAATVLFKAELQTALSQFARGPRFLLPRSDRIRQVFKQVGLFEDMRLDVSVKLRREDVVHWETATGDDIDNNRIADALEKFAKKIPARPREFLLGSAGEALGNSVEHAYEFPRAASGVSMPRRWWAFFNFRDGVFFMALCDLGCGIPVHLPLKHVSVAENLKSRLTNLQLKVQDAAYIKTAAEEGVSATEGKNRGKGLPEMVRDLKAGVIGNLRVFSNSGMVRWDSSGGSGTAFNYNESIFGTILLWEVKLPISLEADNEKRND